MVKNTIPKEVLREVEGIIESFNKSHLRDRIGSVAYFTETKGKYLYLKRHEFGNKSPVARLTYTGDIKKWEFAIFKWSSEQFDPDEWMFPGAGLVDGTIEGAMKAGLKAYPV